MDQQALFEIFKLAIEHEYEAYEFYRKSASETTNAEAKSLFESFAATELGHKTELEKLYKSLKKQ